MGSSSWISHRRSRHGSCQPDAGLLESRQDSSFPRHFWIARLWLGRAYAGLGRFAESIATIRTAVTAEPSTFMPEALLAYVLALAGQREKAMSIVERVEAGTQQRYVMPYAVAIAHTGLGNVEAALDWLDRSLAERGSATSAWTRPSTPCARTPASRNS